MTSVSYSANKLFQVEILSSPNFVDRPLINDDLLLALEIANSATTAVLTETVFALLVFIIGLFPIGNSSPLIWWQRTVVSVFTFPDTAIERSDSLLSLGPPAD